MRRIHCLIIAAMILAPVGPIFADDVDRLQCPGGTTLKEEVLEKARRYPGRRYPIRAVNYCADSKGRKQGEYRVYDEKKLLISRKWYSDDKITFRQFLTYDRNGRLAKVATDDERGNASGGQYLYNEIGRVAQKHYYMSSSKTGNDDLKIDFAYGSGGAVESVSVNGMPSEVDTAKIVDEGWAKKIRADDVPGSLNSDASKSRPGLPVR